MTLIRPAVVIIALASPYMVHADPMSDAFSQGGTLGRSGNSQARGNVTGGTAAATVPGYSSTAPQAGLYGYGALGAPAGAAISNCAQAGDGTAYGNQGCNAINFSQSNPTRRSQFTIAPGDPMLARSKAIANDPNSIAGNVTGTYSACSTQTITRPDIYETRQCNQYRSTESMSCEKQLNVQVYRSDSCIPGTWFGNFWVNTWGNGEVNSRFAGVAINAYCQPDGPIRMSMQAICTESPCYGYAEAYVSPTDGAVSPQTFANFMGRSWYQTDMFNRVDYNGGGCNADQCSFSFCTRYEDEYMDCDGDWGCSAPITINETRACGTFSFDRPRSIFTVTDTWDNQCAVLDARLP